MQKIEQVYLDIVVTLLALENLHFFVKSAIYGTFYDILMIRLGFAGHIFLCIIVITRRSWHQYARVIRHARLDFDRPGVEAWPNKFIFDIFTFDYFVFPRNVLGHRVLL